MLEGVLEGGSSAGRFAGRGGGGFLWTGESAKIPRERQSPKLAMALGFSLVGVLGAGADNLLVAANQWKWVAHRKRKKGLLIGGGNHGGGGKAIALARSPLQLAGCGQRVDGYLSVRIFEGEEAEFVSFGLGE